jgi:hypothetical protein
VRNRLTTWYAIGGRNFALQITSRNIRRNLYLLHIGIRIALKLSESLTLNVRSGGKYQNHFTIIFDFGNAVCRLFEGT